MRKESRARDSILFLIGLLLVSTAMSICAYARVLAKYAISDNQAGDARVATWNFTDGVDKIDISEIEKPGDEANMQFNLSGKAEVSSRYRLALSLDGSMPLEVSIRETTAGSGSAEPVVQISLSELNNAIAQQASGDDGAMPLVKFSEPVSQPPNTPVMRSFTLHVEWPKSETNPEYPYGRSVLKAGVYVEQVN